MSLIGDLDKDDPDKDDHDKDDHDKGDLDIGDLDNDDPDKGDLDNDDHEMTIMKGSMYPIQSHPFFEHSLSQTFLISAKMIIKHQDHILL